MDKAPRCGPRTQKQSSAVRQKQLVLLRDAAARDEIAKPYHVAKPEPAPESRPPLFRTRYRDGALGREAGNKLLSFTADVLSANPRSELKSASNQPQPADDVENCPPLFRWAGGKRRLIAQIRPLLPAKFSRYYEPFCGGAAVFFALRPKVAMLADRNAELINCYRQVKERPKRVIAAFQKLKNTETEFYRIRGSLPGDTAGAAARLIYLMNYSFNGIYRVNSRGKFNVPYGGKKKRPFDVERIRKVSRALSDVELINDDFEAAASDARAGDLIYFDPPYTVAHGNNGFIQYNEKIFSWEDQVRLESFAKRLARRGCHVIISNAEHPTLLELYADFKRETVRRHSGIGASVDCRKRISEYVFYL